MVVAVRRAAAWATILHTLGLASAALVNTALVFVKPHAATDACEKFVVDHLAQAGVRVVRSGVKLADEIESEKLIDQHYGSLARLAMEVQPADMDLSSKATAAFAETFGVEWSAALGSMLRNDEAMAKLGVDGVALEPMWRSGTQCKLAPGTYVSRLAGTAEPTYTINGFYPAMRQQFVEAGAEVRYLVCEFEEAEVSWARFRREVIGATNPAEAAAGSARAKLLARWQELGLGAEPSYGQNGVHASAGPLEGLKERCVWSGASLATDALAAQLVAGGLPLPTLEEWLRDNPVVTLGGETDKIFDLTEEASTDAVLELCRAAPPAGGEPAEEAAPREGAYEYAPAMEMF